MKTNAIIRIILFSLAIVILLGILISALGFNFLMFDRSTVTTSENQLPVASNGMTTQTIADSSSIRNLEIDWVSGSIILLPDENATDITVSETYVDNIKNQMVVEQSGKKLKIQYCKDNIKLSSFGVNIDFSKDLIITVPADWVCQSFDVDAASTDVTVRDMRISEVEIDSAAGVCDFINCNVDKLDVDTASGDISFKGALNKMDFDGASGNCCLELTNVPNRITMDGMSSDLELIFPEDCGFTVSIDALSSDFHCDFPTNSHNGDFVYGDGHCQISFNGMSGDLVIRKASVSSSHQDCTDPYCTIASHNHSDNCNDPTHNHSGHHNS